MNALITLRVPATSANLGSGFDTIGMAVSLYNIFKVTELLPEGEYKVEALGEGARELSSPKANLVVKAYEETCERWNVKGPGFALWCHNIIPLCRGLGSSAGAVVAGVLIAKYLTGYDADDDELLRAMTMIEGHPDNVAPCFLGGMVVSCWDGKELRYVNLPPLPPEVLCVVAVPDERVKTSDARNALPMEVPFGDAVFNVGRAALLTAAWATGKWDYLKWGMDDRLHQPYRSKLFSGGADLIMLGNRQVNARAYVARFNFSGADQEKKCGMLSGGERNRLHLALALKEEGNVLLLDEPTNDIDVNTLRALEEGLENFAGCAVVISHDRWFLDRIATHILSFEGDSKVVFYEGSYSEYEEWKKAQGGDTQPHRVRYKKLMA